MLFNSLALKYLLAFVEVNLVSISLMIFTRTVVIVPLYRVSSYPRFLRECTSAKYSAVHVQDRIIVRDATVQPGHAAYWNVLCL